jgi:hypothetical protein
MQTLRLRQAVVAAADRDAVVAAWQQRLGLGAPFDDPSVDVFGLSNAVLPVGDTFLEVVSPVEPGEGSAAGRHMARHGGDAGYMAIFQVADIDAARDHLRGLGARSVWNADLADIRATHVHPADIGAAIVSFDQAIPEGSWRWAGPGWTDEVRRDVTTGLAGLHLAADDPDALLARWSAVLAIEPDGDRLTLPDGSTVTVGPPTDGGRTGLVGIDVWAADGAAEQSFELAGVRFGVVAR